MAERNYENGIETMVRGYGMVEPEYDRIEWNCINSGMEFTPRYGSMGIDFRNGIDTVEWEYGMETDTPVTELVLLAANDLNSLSDPRPLFCCSRYSTMNRHRITFHFINETKLLHL